MGANSNDHCKKCLKTVGPRAYALECDGCGGWLHAKCAKISSKLYLLIQECQPDCMEIKCPSCKTKTSRKVSSAISKDDDDKADEPILSDSTLTPESEDEQNITCVHVDVPPSSTPVPSPTKLSCDIPVGNSNTLGKTFADAVRTAPLSPNAPTKTCKRPTVKSLLSRIQQLENKIQQSKMEPSTDRPPRPSNNRERSFIVFNAPESSNSQSAERILDDQKFLRSLAGKLFDADEESITVVSAFRLGKRPDNGNMTPRPLKVVLASEIECKRVLSRGHRLRGEAFRILRDLSPEDRLLMRNAVQELKTRREAGESDLRIVNFRVVKSPPRVTWRPLVINMWDLSKD